MSSKKGKYLKSYTEHGFTFITESDGTQKPQCLLGGKVLVNDSMKQTKLREHQEKRHPQNVQDSLAVMKQEKERFFFESSTEEKLLLDGTIVHLPHSVPYCVPLCSVPSSGTLPKHGFAGTQKPMLEVSYKVAYLIAKDKKLHTIGETLIKPCALEMVEPKRWNWCAERSIRRRLKKYLFQMMLSNLGSVTCP